MAAAASSPPGSAKGRVAASSPGAATCMRPRCTAVTRTGRSGWVRSGCEAKKGFSRNRPRSRRSLVSHRFAVPADKQWNTPLHGQGHSACGRASSMRSLLSRLGAKAERLGDRRVPSRAGDNDSHKDLLSKMTARSRPKSDGAQGRSPRLPARLRSAEVGPHAFQAAEQLSIRDVRLATKTNEVAFSFDDVGDVQ